MQITEKIDIIVKNFGYHETILTNISMTFSNTTMLHDFISFRIVKLSKP